MCNKPLYTCGMTGGEGEGKFACNNENNVNPPCADCEKVFNQHMLKKYTPS